MTIAVGYAAAVEAQLPRTPPKIPHPAATSTKQLAPTSKSSILEDILQDALETNAGKLAQQTGCGKTDSPILEKGKLPSEWALKTRGKVFFPSGGKIVSKPDFCAADASSSIQLLHEFYCLGLPGGKTQVVEGVFPCKTGTLCKNNAKGSGACIASPGSGNGCYMGQPPLLDSNHNGTPDACYCPAGTFPTDTSGDGNSDTCTYVTKGEGGVCEQFAAQATKKKSDVKLKATGTDSGGWTLYDYCTNPFGLTHVICSTMEVLNTSATTCGPKQVCFKGNCIDAGSDVCDPTNVPIDPKTEKPDAYKLGFVLINGEPTAWDICTTDKTTARNVICYCPTCGLTYFETPCKIGEQCNQGVCGPTTKIPNDLDGDGIPNNQDSDANGDGLDDNVSWPDCDPETEKMCDELSDTVHPKDPKSGMKLFGDPYVFGITETDLDLTMCGIFLPLPAIKHPDNCLWTKTELLPTLIQYGCSDAQPDSLASSSSLCDWQKGEACDWQAATQAKRGICKKAGKAKVTLVPATPTSPGKVTGTNAFGHPVDHQDECAGEQGTWAILKWKLTDNPEGAMAYLDVCPSQHHCVGGLCVADPCLGKQYNDNNPCTNDICDEATGDPFFFPIPIDDNNFCTIDECVNDKGQAKITHTAVSGGNCSGWAFCQEHPEDATCTPGGVDCAKDPTHPSCPPVGGFDCVACLNTEYQQTHPECAQCDSTQKFCYDSDLPNAPEIKGVTVLFPGIAGAEQMASDVCWGWSNALQQFTTVLQANCGPNNTFHLAPFVCPQNSGGCLDGVCVPKDEKDE